MASARGFIAAVKLVPRQALVMLLRGYRLVLSPWIGNQCRFAPTCSMYGIEAMQRHGALAGSYLTVSRVLRCQPWCEGGCDPVPTQRPRLFTHLLPAATVAPPSEFSSRPLP